MRKRIALAVLIITLAVGGVAIYFVLNQPRSEPANTQAQTTPNAEQHNMMDVDFIKKMLIYHQQAIEMADIALQKSANSDVRQLAQDIKTARETDIAKFKVWLTEWSEPYTNLSDFPQQSGHDMYPTLPGMSTPEELQKLRMLSGVGLDNNFLEIMKTYYDGTAKFTKDSQQSLQFGALIKLVKDLEAVQAKEVTALYKLFNL